MGTQSIPDTHPQQQACQGSVRLTPTSAQASHHARLQGSSHPQLDCGPDGDVWQQQAGRQQPGALGGDNHCAVNLDCDQVISSRRHLQVTAGREGEREAGRGIECLTKFGHAPLNVMMCRACGMVHISDRDAGVQAAVHDSTRAGSQSIPELISTAGKLPPHLHHVWLHGRVGNRLGQVSSNPKILPETQQDTNTHTHHTRPTDTTWLLPRCRRTACAKALSGAEGNNATANASIWLLMGSRDLQDALRTGR